MSAAATNGSRARMPVRWSLVLATVVVLAAIVWLRRAEPSYAEKTQPIPVAGKVGERIEARNFAVTVKRAKLARAYRETDRRSSDEPKMVRPDGIWMSALVEIEALESAGMVRAQVRTRDGNLYVASAYDRPRAGKLNLEATSLVVGLPATGAYFFDVPPDRLAGARLQFHWSGVAGHPESFDHLVDIDLGLDDARARQQVAEAVAVLDLDG